MQLLDRINRTGTTVVIATHDEVLVDKMRRRVIELSNGIMVRDQARGVYGIDGTTQHADGRRGLMPVSVEYVARETASNLWRNRLMTIAAVLTVAVSLTLVGAALLLRQGAANASGQWERGTQVTVWMAPDRRRIRRSKPSATQLTQLNYVRQPCVYWDKARNFTEARKLLPSDVLQATTESQMPTSYWCTPVDAERCQPAHPCPQGDSRCADGDRTAPADPYRGEGDQRPRSGSSSASPSCSSSRPPS